MESTANDHRRRSPLPQILATCSMVVPSAVSSTVAIGSAATRYDVTPRMIPSERQCRVTSPSSGLSSVPVKNELVIVGGMSCLLTEYHHKVPSTKWSSVRHRNRPRSICTSLTYTTQNHPTH